MKDAAYKWIELALKNWAVILPILLFLGSAAGWTFSGIESSEKDELTDAMRDQIEVLVDYKPRQVGQKCDCNAIFSGLIKKHIKQHKDEH